MKMLNAKKFQIVNLVDITFYSLKYKNVKANKKRLTLIHD